MTISGIIRRDETILRLGPYGTGFRMTWAADDRQFVSILSGFAEPSKQVFHTRVLTVSGHPPNLVFQDVAGYPEMPMRPKESAHVFFRGGGCLALDGHVYQYLTASNHPYLNPDATFWPDFYWDSAKLIYSSDNGLTWRNQDKSSPVRWEKWDALSPKNMIFFNEESAGVLAWLSILQMGKNYELNQDGYVYVYGPNGYTDGTMNELVMFRVLKSCILDRHSYEFFSGICGNGRASWTRDISARAVVHTFPRGWVNRCDANKFPGQTPWAWSPSLTYNAPLGVYMMTSWGTGCTPDGRWFGKPSYLGLWVASTPWGPFTQIHEELAWTPINDSRARAFQPQIAPKWISADGKSFWLVWSSYQYEGEGGETENPDLHFQKKVKQLIDDTESDRFFVEWTKKHMSQSVFNAQRVDILVS